MPYILIEYSANLLDDDQIMLLLSAVHEAAVSSKLFDRAAIRSRAVKRDHVIMGDGNPRNAFILITARIRKGRDETKRRQFGEDLLEAASRHLDGAFNGRSMALNVEIQEIEGLGFRRHELHQPASGERDRSTAE